MDFKQLSRLGLGSRAETMLLEVCNWDEEECALLMTRLNEFFVSFANEHANIENMSAEQHRIVYNNIRVGLRQVAQPEQIDTIIEYINLMLKFETEAMIHD